MLKQTSLFILIVVLAVIPALAIGEKTDEENIFFSGLTEKCQLPCWNDLVVGESTRDELTLVVDRLELKDGGSRNFFNEDLRGYGRGQSFHPGASNWWNFGIAGYTDAEETVQALTFEWTHTKDRNLFIPNILLEYGTPSQVMISYDRLGPSPHLLITLQYDELRALFQYYIWIGDNSSDGQIN
ncbi:hypothetical protein HC928_06600 [bacterium]|nr:hypothetical protein [bacterium]